MRAASTRRFTIATDDRIYFARRAAEGQELAVAAREPQVADAHRKLQRAYRERASTGERPAMQLPPQQVG